MLDQLDTWRPVWILCKVRLHLIKPLRADLHLFFVQLVAIVYYNFLFFIVFICGINHSLKAYECFPLNRTRVGFWVDPRWFPIPIFYWVKGTGRHLGRRLQLSSSPLRRLAPP